MIVQSYEYDELLSRLNAKRYKLNTTFFGIFQAFFVDSIDISILSFKIKKVGMN